MSGIPTSRWIGFLAVAAAGCAADLATKTWFFSWPALDHGAVWWIWNDHFGFQQSLNEGALFGMGQGGAFVFAIISIVAVIAIPVWLFVFRAARDRFLTFTMAFICSGILGNLYDRLGIHGLQWDAFNPMRQGEPVYAVRDWILFQWSDQWRWPNFNIADSMLVCGAIFLLWHGLFVAQPEEAAAEDSNGEPDA